jgi:CheY-like chemotaxis protein
MLNHKMILVAEDDPTDAFFLQRAFGKTGTTVGLKFVRDGQEAIDYLRGEPPFIDRSAHPMPQLLLLDLKMPRMNGFEVLHWLKTQPGLKRLLVIVFSSSAETGDINRAYDLGANSYLVKPHATEQLLELVNRVEN